MCVSSNYRGLFLILKARGTIPNRADLGHLSGRRFSNVVTGRDPNGFHEISGAATRVRELIPSLGERRR